MKFPNYVPTRVQAYISYLIEGSDRGFNGYAAAIAECDRLVREIKAGLELRDRQGKTEDLEGVRRICRTLQSRRDWMVERKECLERLGYDDRMRGVYVKLHDEITQDTHWERFVLAATAAQKDYAIFRKRMRLAESRAKEVANSVINLKQAINRFTEIRAIPPSEFYYLPPRPGEEKEVSRPPLIDNNELDHWEIAILQRSGIDLPSDVSNFDVSAELRYEQEIHPRLLSVVLNNLEKAARNYRHIEDEGVSVAVKSQKRNHKTEYLRGFAHLLTEGGLRLTPVVMRAMAVVSNVVLNEPDMDVSYDDVRKSVASARVR